MLQKRYTTGIDQTQRLLATVPKRIRASAITASMEAHGADQDAADWGIPRRSRDEPERRYMVYAAALGGGRRGVDSHSGIVLTRANEAAD
jgi:hypothetical protein